MCIANESIIYFFSVKKNWERCSTLLPDVIVNTLKHVFWTQLKLLLLHFPFIVSTLRGLFKWSCVRGIRKSVVEPPPPRTSFWYMNFVVLHDLFKWSSFLHGSYATILPHNADRIDTNFICLCTTKTVKKQHQRNNSTDSGPRVYVSSICSEETVQDEHSREDAPV